ncbi:MAG: hypothetical protein WB785_21425 [Mycobacterium sp.]|uniref:hypothetical protein n=1 Tax=Mycobacterium sp. TaxID=1785 RepID=UPI003C635289
MAIWGLGTLGSACLRALQRLPEFELVAVYTYNPEKSGKDAGLVIGIPATGVDVTNDRDAFMGCDAECVLYTPRDFGFDYTESDKDLQDLLGAGRNVITALAYRNLAAWRGEGIAEQLTASCQHGRSTLYVTGLEPDFMSERLTMTLSGLCTDIEHMRLVEIFRSDGVGDEMWLAGGFGLPPGDSNYVDMAAQLVRNYFVPSMMWTAQQMGRPIERVEPSIKSILAPHDIELPDRNRRVAKGTVGGLEFSWDLYSGEAVFFRGEGYYYVGDVMRPPKAVGDDCWLIEIEGRPSVSLTLQALASAKLGTVVYDDDPTSPGYYATAGPLIQAIPDVVEAEAGIRDDLKPHSFWRTDFRG